MTLSLVLLAAGLGSRYGGPKQLDPLGPHGETLMDYAAFDAKRAGFERVVVVTRKSLAAEVNAGLLSRAGSSIEVVVVEQELDRLPPGFTVPAGREAPWGTAHAVLVARAAVDGPFAVVNADDFYGASSYAVLAGFLREREAGAVDAWGCVGFPLRATLSDTGTVNRAECVVTPDGWLSRVVELRGIARDGDGGRVGDRVLSGDMLVSMNCWAFTPPLFAELDAAFHTFLATGPGAKDECLLPSVVNDAIARGIARTWMLESEGPWCGVTHRDDRPAAVAVLADLHARGAYPEHLWA
jgi:hypothetical protein